MTKMKNNQLELFQLAGERESTIFERAKKSKEVVQDLYKDLNVLNNEVHKTQEIINEKYGILRIKVDVDQISDKNALEEPSTPKMFIWQFSPSIILTIEDEDDYILRKGDEYNNQIGTRIIPKWINTLFTSNSFTRSEFLTITQQYYTLELINNILNDTNLISSMQNKLNGKDLLIYFESKLFPYNGHKYEGLYERDLINKIKNFYNKINTEQVENYYYIGCRKDFVIENDLLLDLDLNKTIKEKREMLYQQPDFDSLVDIFQNDYLFLNNAEFFQQKTNTHNWESNCILSPNVLDGNFIHINEDNLISNLEYRKVYCYTKKAGEAFFRNDILFPKKKYSINKFREIISIAQFLSNDIGK